AVVHAVLADFFDRLRFQMPLHRVGVYVTHHSRSGSRKDCKLEEHVIVIALVNLSGIPWQGKKEDDSFLTLRRRLYVLPPRRNGDGSVSQPRVERELHGGLVV